MDMVQVCPEEQLVYRVYFHVGRLFGFVLVVSVMLGGRVRFITGLVREFEANSLEVKSILINLS